MDISGTGKTKRQLPTKSESEHNSDSLFFIEKTQVSEAYPTDHA